MKRMSYEEIAQKREQEDLRIIDVREQDEYDAVHVKGVELFPLSKLREGERPEPDDRPVAVICRSGGRSAMACQILEGEGWEECINVEGGTNAAIEMGEEEVERG
jgi:rhodanese-related sulfurtransferase